MPTLLGPRFHQRRLKAGSGICMPGTCPSYWVNQGLRNVFCCAATSSIELLPALRPYVSRALHAHHFLACLGYSCDCGSHAGVSSCSMRLVGSVRTTAIAIRKHGLKGPSGECRQSANRRAYPENIVVGLPMVPELPPLLDFQLLSLLGTLKLAQHRTSVGC